MTAVNGSSYPFIKLGIPSIMVSDDPADLHVYNKKVFKN